MLIFILLPVIGAFIGWGTNLLAIRSLFYPLKPIKLPLTKVVFQGLIPKRKKELAQSVGNVVEKELFSWDDLINQIDNSFLQQEIMTNVVEFVKQWLDKKMPAIVPRRITKVMEELLINTITQEFTRKLPEILLKIGSAAEKEANIGRMVEEKINNMSLQNIEQMVYQIGRKELKQIEYLGAILGFLIGIVQALLVYFIS